ncbi:hypothetical protein [uncultured Tenacibaculum sp.]|uniref:hypothetical protein n=1 Tax=uncultured Tenacibaculum sp. TaxID=174713 RepID=UPI00262236C4|nr:hypothetical protein [uncultured Tenacibaculum sp.]
MKAFFKQHWRFIVTVIIVPVITFFLGVEMREINLKKAENEAIKESYYAENQKIENFNRVIKINGDMIEQIKTDFDDRAVFLKRRIKEVEEINLRLDKVVRNQQQLIIEQELIITKQEKQLKKYRKLYGKV